MSSDRPDEPAVLAGRRHHGDDCDRDRELHYEQRALGLVRSAADTLALIHSASASRSAAAVGECRYLRDFVGPGAGEGVVVGLSPMGLRHHCQWYGGIL